MRIARPFLVLLLALLPFIGWAQQKNYGGQHVSIKRTTGDSIQFEIGSCAGFKPMIKDGKVVWGFLNWEEIEDSPNHEIALKEKFSIDNVESVDFRSYEYDEKKVRQALIEFYQALDGDNWGNHENWCSDKPIWEWYGVNGSDGYNSGWMKYPWVEELWLTLNSPPLGHLPECISRMGLIRYLALYNSNIEGEIPACLGDIYSLHAIVLNGNKFTGTIPAIIGDLPNLNTIILENNLLSGPLPEDFILKCMNNPYMSGNGFNIIRNNFSGKVPQSIQEHPRFSDFWPSIVIQNNPLDVSDLIIPAPVFSAKDINGNMIDLAEAYKNNKYTLLYKWAFGDNLSETFNQKLVPAYKAYKDKGLEVIGIHYDLNLDDGLAEFLKTHDIPWDNIIAKDWGYHDYNGTSIFQWGGSPQVFLVDQNGHIVFNSLIDQDGNNQISTNYIYELFTYLEEQLGSIEYNYYTSTDYFHDGEVVTLQKAKKGNGFDLVFVGEGFTDKDIEEGGIFDQRMNEALEQFFAYEPYKSLRDRFNVYGVKAVSPNAEFVDGCTHAIDVDYEKALEYASKVTDLIPDRPMRVTVVYNNASGGRSFCMMMEDDSYVCFAMDGITTVLNHESGGHGIGKLLDEYVEDDGQHWIAIPEEQKTELDNIWATFGWGANVDWRSDPTEVKWAKFINDTRYADESIGIYEGSYLYQFGTYRPTENSMMRYNNVGFNAPSREEIYKRVMKESEGDGWTYDYESFVTFDAAGHQQFVDALNTNMARQKGGKKVQQVQRTAPPVFLKGTWRDALKKNKK
ncbi:MAG: redoxin domain-containing protein [Prevotella sp.]|nr:redoxin domain-containing protein [Prevotella sp.]